MTASFIHPTAIIEDGATLGQGVRIGPYCVIGAKVVLGDEVELKSHVVVQGKTRIGAKTRVFPFASLGHEPQDLKFHGEESTLEIGEHCTIREHVTMNPGTEGGGLVTRVGNHCLFMTASHVAHDCQVGNYVILANNATLAGHVVVEDYVVIGGLSAVHQFVRIGKHAMIGGMSGIEADVIPYGSAMGDRAGLEGLNLIGLKRRGFSRDAIHALREVYRALFHGQEGTFQERLDVIAGKFQEMPEVQDVVEFIRRETTRSRSFCQPKANLD